MMNRSLRNTALSLAVLATPVTALATSVPGSPQGTTMTQVSHRPSGGDYQHDSDGLARGAASGGVIGAVAGGPPGAVVGMLLGGSFGDTVQQRQQAEEQATELAQLKARNKRLSYELDAVRKARERQQEELARLKRRQAQDMLAGELALDVLFATDSSELTARGDRRVAELAAMLKRDDATDVTLVGQADRRGAESYNQKLSEARAEAVRDALVEHGIRPDRLALDAIGEQKADAPVGDPDGLARDRRVTIDLRPQGRQSDQVAGVGSR